MGKNSNIHALDHMQQTAILKFLSHQSSVSLKLVVGAGVLYRLCQEAIYRFLKFKCDETADLKKNA